MSQALEAAEAAATLDLLRAAPPEAGAHVLEIGGALCIRVDALRGERMFNRVIGLGLSGPADEAQLDAIDEFYGPDGYMVCLDPEAGLDARLRARGFTDGYAWMRFGRRAEPLEPLAGNLHLVAGRREDFATIVRAAFGMPDLLHGWLAALADRPGWECWVAYDGDAPAGAGALYRADDVVWLGFGGTLAAHRGKGAQGALLVHRVARAHALGARTATTETGVARDGAVGPSYRNILRTGFSELYVRANLLMPPR